LKNLNTLSIGIYRTRSKGFRIISNSLRNKYSTKIFTLNSFLQHNSPIDVMIVCGDITSLIHYIENGRFRRKMRRLVRSGTGFIGVCGGSILGSWLKLLPVKAKLDLSYLYYYFKPKWDEATIQSLDNKLFRGTRKIAWWASPYFEANGENVSALYSSEIPYTNIKGKPAIVTGAHGNGSIILFGPHPEYPLTTRNNLDLLEKAIRLCV